MVCYECIAFWSFCTVSLALHAMHTPSLALHAMHTLEEAWHVISTIDLNVSVNGTVHATSLLVQCYGQGCHLSWGVIIGLHARKD